MYKLIKDNKINRYIIDKRIIKMTLDFNKKFSYNNKKKKTRESNL